ncbi:MAG: metalloregulator ArsR/SmtB family transcription factor [Pirellulales bacterium]
MKKSLPADALFRACADRTRLRLLNLLIPGERCVCDLVDAVQLSQPKVSRHLAYLRRAGLVESRKEGLWSYYCLARPGTRFHAKLLECLQCCFTETLEWARDARRLAQCGGRECC